MEELSIRQTASGLIDILAQLTNQQKALVACLQSKGIILSDELGAYVRLTEKTTAAQWQQLRDLIRHLPE